MYWLIKVYSIMRMRTRVKAMIERAFMAKMEKKQKQNDKFANNKNN